MKWLSRIYRLLFTPLLSQRQLFARREKDQKKLVCAYSRGNISLQQGRYITAPEISALRDKVLKAKI